MISIKKIDKEKQILKLVKKIKHNIDLMYFVNDNMCIEIKKENKEIQKEINEIIKKGK